MSIIQGIQANKNAKKVAGSIERRGEQDAQLRRVQAEELFAAIRMRAPMSGVDSTSQTALDLEKQAAHFEDVDIGRIRLKAAVEAYNTRIQGQAQLAASVQSTVNLALSSVQLGLMAGRLNAATDVANNPVTAGDITGRTPVSGFNTKISFGAPSLQKFEFTTPPILGVTAPWRPSLNTILNFDSRIKGLDD